MTESASHADAWMSLPWLANGRLPTAERMRLEEHVRDCAQCSRELALQRQLCDLLTEPERVTYAPGPSFRKLMDRIDGRAPAKIPESRPARLRTLAVGRAAAWRPPGLAWAASFVLLAGFLGLAATTYRWSQPLYVTHTQGAANSTHAVLHIAFVPSLSMAGVGEALRSAGARVVEGPDSTGIVGVAPAAAADAAGANDDLRALAARLRADARVRWVEPLTDAVPADTRQHGPPQP